MNKTILTLALVLFNLSLYGQIEKSSLNTTPIPLAKEKTVLLTNTDFLFTGESLFFNLYIFENNKASEISKIGYVELVGANNNVIISHKLKLKKGVAQGHFFIPSEVRTGNYKVVGYTNWTKNNNDNHSFAKDLYIVNPFSANNQELKDTSTIVDINKVANFNKGMVTHPGLSITTSKNSFKTREAIVISISGNDALQNGHYNLSVRKVDSIDIVNSNDVNHISSKPSEKFHIPELRGELISGKISNIKDSNAIKHKSIALSIPGKDYLFKMANTNDKGLFYFNLNENYTNEKAIFQVVDNNKEDFTITIDSNNYDNYDALVFKNIRISPDLKHNLEQRSIQNQIENAYYENKQDSIINLTNDKPFYSPLGIVYKLDDYTRFNTVRETFIEVIPEAGMRKNDDSYNFLVYDFEATEGNNTITNLKPLVLVDGVIIQNNDDLVFYNPRKIEKITVVKGQYLYSTKLFQGIIDVSTFLGDFKPSVKGDYVNQYNLKKPLDTKKYYQPDYSSSKNKRIPDYRRQLLWEPNIDFNENSSLKIKTYASDNLGTYEVLLQGYDSKGKLVKATSYFTIDN